MMKEKEPKVKKEKPVREKKFKIPRIKTKKDFRMNWSNLKIGTKLLAGFIIVSAIASAIGIEGYLNITNIANVRMPAIQELLLIGSAQSKVMIAQGELINTALMEPKSRQQQYDNVTAGFAEAAAASKAFETLPKTEEENKLWRSFQYDWERWKTDFNEVYDFEQQKDKLIAEGAIASNEKVISMDQKAILGSIDSKKTFKITQDDLSKLVELNRSLAQNAGQNASIMIIIFLAGGVAASILLGIFFTRMVSKPIKATVKCAKALASGDLDEPLVIKTKDEFGELACTIDQEVRQAFRNIANAQVVSEKRNAYQNEQVDKLIVCLEKLYCGNLDWEFEVTEADEDTSDLYNIYYEIKNCLRAYIQEIKGLVLDVNTLAEEAVEGSLKTRADENKHQGEYRKIVEGFNHTLDALISPLDEAAQVLAEVSKGNLNIEVAGDYKGDHAIIKDALNITIYSLKGYITEISQVLSEMARGNLDVEIISEYKGNFVELKTSINHIITSLNALMLEISTVAEQVASGSTQVSQGNQAISQGATEQASSIEELTASLNAIAEQTRLNAENSNKSNEMALEAKKAAVEGNDQMKEMLKSMEEINESSESISKIIKVIDDIAFQTNILALNAAVEAARAGVHGKGFAVVAEEVRNLAARSANAAKETTELIESSKKKVGSGTKIAQVTAQALGKIAQSVDKTVELGEEIAVASGEQAAGIMQINQGVEQMSLVVQTNSATAQEGAAASQELSGQAELLKEKIASFKLKEDNGHDQF